MVRELLDSWADFMAKWDWQGFWTLTTEDTYSSWALRRAGVKWAQRFTRTEPLAPSFILFQDWGKNGRLHFHGLTRNENASRRIMWEDWKKRHGRARSEEYRADKGARWYCAKYLTKSQGEVILDERRTLQWQMEGYHA